MGNSTPLLIRGWPVNRRDFPARHAQVHRELAAMMDLIVQKEPQDIESPQITLLFRAGLEFHRGIELRLVDLADLITKSLEGFLDFADHALPIGRDRRHVRRREFHLSRSE